MKKLLSVLLAVLTLTAFATGFQVSAASKEYGVEGDWHYRILDDATICIDGYYGKETEITIPSKLLGRTVTVVGGSYYDFDCPNADVKTINIPASVTDIGTATFSEMYYLENVNVDSNNTKYSSVNGVLFSKGKWVLYCYPRNKKETSYKIPSTVKTIGEYAFYSAKNLTEITIPKSVTEVREHGFDDTGVTDVTVPASVEKMGCEAFGGFYAKKITLEDGLKRLDCFSLNGFYITKISIPASVEYIEEGALAGLSALHEVTVDSANENYRSYGGNLYTKDRSVLLCRPSAKSATSFTIGSPVKRIGSYAMFQSENLQEVIINNGVEEIGSNAFRWCYNLEKVTMPDTGKKIEVRAFEETAIKEIKIPDGITKIELSTFECCSNLETVEIPDSVTELASNSFWGCVKLTEVVLPEHLEKIGYYAFTHTGLNKINVPPSVKKIDNGALGYKMKDGTTTKKEDFEIYGISGTEAQKYAERKDIRFISTGNFFGDVNSDGQINVQDATAIQSYIAGLTTLNDFEKTAADIDLSGEINVLDATALQKKLANII